MHSIVSVSGLFLVVDVVVVVRWIMVQHMVVVVVRVNCFHGAAVVVVVVVVVVGSINQQFDQRIVNTIHSPLDQPLPKCLCRKNLYLAY